MKKKFRRVLASLLAVLMILGSMPMTAFAFYNYEYDGYAELGEEDYVNWDGGFEFGDQIVITDPAGGEDHNSILTEMKPEMTITVSSMGNVNDGNYIRQQYYGWSPAQTYEKVKAAGNIKNPAELKAGDMIAIAFEFGGMECLYTCQTRGKYDPAYLEPGLIAGSSGNFSWRKATSSTQATPVVGATKFYAPFANTGTGCDPETSTFYTSMGSIEALYCRDANTKYDTISGMISNVMTFKVLQDCDLKDIMTLDLEGYTYIDPYNPYDPALLADENQPLEYIPDDQNYDFTPGSDILMERNGHMDIIWTDYEKAEETQQYTVKFTAADGSTVSETKYDAGTPADSVTVPSNTATKSDNDETHTVYTWPEVQDVTGDVEYKEVATPTAHQYNDVPGSSQDATCTAPGKEADQKCDVCQHVKTGAATDKLKHSYTGELTPVTDKTHANKCIYCQEVNPEATACTFKDQITEQPEIGKPGTKTWTCECGNSYTEVIPPLQKPQYKVEFKNAAGAIVSTEYYEEGTEAASVVVPANTATKSDNDETHTVYTWPEVQDVTGEVVYEEQSSSVAHDYKDVPGTAVPEQCEAPGKEANQKCDTCQHVKEGAVIPQKGHDWVEDSRTPATVKDAEKIHYRCNNGCGQTKTEDGQKALGINITVDAEELGTLTLTAGSDPVDVSEGKTVNVPYGTEVTLTAQANEGATFFGWEAEGTKVVTNETTYTFTAIADAKFTSLIEANSSSKFTVVFYDTYGNAISSQTVTNGSEIQIPDGPDFIGYTFEGWSMSDDEIKALTKAASITAKYVKNDSAKFTVTATGCEISGGELSGNDTLAEIPYDTLVTVTKADAKAWKIGEATVAYGDSYSFYVGSDVTVVPVTDEDVTAAPTVAAVSADQVAGSHKVVFLATRSMAGDATYVNAGFVYGKDLNNDDLVLEMVGKKGTKDTSGNVKAYYCTTDAQQFSVSYGVTAQTGTASARAFLAYESDGEITVIYAEPQVHTY